MDYLSRPVLVFSKNYMPISQISLKRAIILLVTGRAEPMEYESTEGVTVHSPTTALFVPFRIRLTILPHIRQGWRVPAVSRREVLRRDKHTCQYCGSTKHLTIDHVIPRSKGGAHVWNNVVTACVRCNSLKGDKTPQQAGLALRTLPKPPLHPVIAFAEHYWRENA